MRQLDRFFSIMLLLVGMTLATGCESDIEQVPGEEEGETWVVKRFDRNGIKLQVVDVTAQMKEVSYWGLKSVPVRHVPLEKLPTAIQDKALAAGMGMSATVFRMEYKGKTYYDISSVLSSSLFNIYDEKGERFQFQETKNTDDFVSQFQNVCCVLILYTEVVKDATGAPNRLTGIWQTDWQHLTHDGGQQAIIALYPDLPFSITEVKRFDSDGTGYLRTVKQFRDGHNEVALDPFRYELTDYQGGEAYEYEGHYYKCYFEAGDVIEYLVRSRDGWQTMAGFNSLANYPWFKQTEDRFASLTVNAGQKYGKPARDENSPIVGRWTGKGSDYGNGTSFTLVFRSDNTGYILIGQQYDEPFAYTITYKESEAEVTLYKYNTGFIVSDGFAKSIFDLSFDPTILPKGKTYKAKINGNSLLLEGWSDNLYYRE